MHGMVLMTSIDIDILITSTCMVLMTCALTSLQGKTSYNDSNSQLEPPDLLQLNPVAFHMFKP